MKPFDLTKAPLFRVQFVKTEEQQFLMLDMHHINADGISSSIFIKDLADIYSERELSELKIQYKDFAHWQSEFLISEKIKNQEEYWTNLYADEIPVLDLPTDYARGAKMSYEGASYNFEISEKLTEKLNTLSVGNGATLFMVLLTAYNVLLAKYSGQQDIVVGVAVTGRNYPDLEGIIGMFVNTLAIRSYPTLEIDFAEYLHRVKDQTIEAFENQDYPFEMLIEKLNIQRDLSRNPLFDTMFTMQNFDRAELEVGNMKLAPYHLENTTAKFDLELTAFETNDRIEFAIDYCTGLFKKTTIARLAGHFVKILGNIAADPLMELTKIDMVSKEEKRQILEEFNSNQAEFHRDRSIYQLIEEHAKKSPDRIALKFKNDEISFLELNQRANQLARVLRRYGVETDKTVGVFMERSPLMVISILAIWKAGGAYIPIDPDFPEQRILDILNDSGSTAVLTKIEYCQNYLKTNYHGQVLQLDEISEEVQNESNENLDLKLDMTSLSYVIYTSGSTGKPKGAMIEHIGMMNHIQAKINDLKLTKDSIVAQNSSHCFDISVWQFFVALTLGGKTVIYPNDLILDPRNFVSEIQKDKITILEVVPSFLSVLLDYLEKADENVRSLDRIVYLLVTGETVKPILVERWFNIYPDIKMVNAYGPTEASDDITHFIMDKAVEMERVPIGNPIQNMNIYIVDSNMNLCPMGVKGEICVAGVGVGRGYLQNPSKTKAVFREDPFAEGKVRLYMTGDLGRWLEGGTIEFFGRKDYQVKVRGYRIELGEIESKLVNHEDIKEAVVIVREDSNSNKYLCAYAASDVVVNIAKVKEYLLENLPEYMVPAHFVILDSLPLTPNGKFNRKALPEPEISLELSDEYLVPETETEKELADIWANLLKLDKVGVNNNFFDLGGNSLLAIRMLELTRDRYPINVADLFSYPTIKELAGYIDRKMEEKSPQQIDVQDVVRMLSMGEITSEEAKALLENKGGV